MARLGAIIALILCVLWLPFWVTLILGLTAVFYFKNFWAIIPIFLLYDLLYGLPQARWGEFQLLGLVMGSAIWAGAEVLKRRLKFYDSA